MKFWEALKELQEYGKGIYRTSWTGNGNRDDLGIAQFLNVRQPDASDADPAMTFPFLFLSCSIGAEFVGCIPWQPSQADLFSEDWETL